MRLPGLLLALALAGCGGTESVTVTETRTETRTETVVRTETATATTADTLPAAVAETHAALLEAASSGDYERLRPLVGSDFSYSFGAPEEGPVEYWQRIERETGDSPIAILEQLLRLPYTLHAGTYVWPFAFDEPAADLTAYERELLGDLVGGYGPGGDYLGWRAGIVPDGRWAFFVAGD